MPCVARIKPSYNVRTEVVGVNGFNHGGVVSHRVLLNATNLTLDDFLIYDVLQATMARAQAS